MKKKKTVAFINGISRSLDLGATAGKQTAMASPSLRNPSEIDARALAGDWAMVGKDLKTAMDKFDKRSDVK